MLRHSFATLEREWELVVFIEPSFSVGALPSLFYLALFSPQLGACSYVSHDAIASMCELSLLINLKEGVEL